MLNVAAIMGRLTADPELRHTQNDIAVTSFTVAVDRSYARAGTERQTDFIDVVAWRQTAEFVCKYFQKGSMIAVTGSIQTRNYEDRQGNKRKAFEIVASDVSFTGSKRESGSAGHDLEPPPIPAEAAKILKRSWETTTCPSKPQAVGSGGHLPIQKQRRLFWLWQTGLKEKSAAGARAAKRCAAFA